ncbi:MAG TPA: sigma-70 family RNA polymerase sigma factor, partial [Actinomycetes bacterium]
MAGDELLRTLYAEHAGPLLGYVLKLTDGDRQRAEDVVQETLLRAWRHPESLDPSRGSLRPWLWTVARNIVVDAARARRARPQEVSEDALAVIPVEDQIDQALLAWEVAEALGT